MKYICEDLKNIEDIEALLPGDLVHVYLAGGWNNYTMLVSSDSDNEGTVMIQKLTGHRIRKVKLKPEDVELDRNGVCYFDDGKLKMITADMQAEYEFYNRQLEENLMA